LQGVAGRFTSHITPGQAVQLLVHQGNESSERLLVPLAPGLKQLGYFIRGKIPQTILSIKRTRPNYIPVPNRPEKNFPPTLQFSSGIFALER
jgi:hypothetical protein